MPAIGSLLRRYWLETAWGLFAATNVAVMLLAPKWETIPFHFVWVSLTLLYGLRVWTLRVTVAVLAGVTLITGGAMVFVVLTGRHERLDELTEVPLMAAMFVAMIWHAQRRQAAMEGVRRAAESEHRLLERAQEFVRDASHELRTPITVATGHAELVKGAVEGQAREDAEVVLDELNRLSRISERLLLLAAAEGPDFLRLAPMQPASLVAEAQKRWVAAAPRRWRVRLEGKGWVGADADRLRIALDAVIENAVNFTATGSQITLVARAENGMAVLEVSDAGEGIPADQLERIFERFARSDVDRSRGRGGTGLGLAIAKAIVEAHGGSISVRSVLGQGSTFALRLPGFRPVASEADQSLSQTGVHTVP
jgi:two-component system OmpR family sensor kinase